MSATLADKAFKLESHTGSFHIEAVTLTVRDSDRVARFYRDVIGLSVIAESRNRIDLGNDGVVLLTLLADANAEAATAGAPGLFHTAFLLPSRENLGAWLATAVANQWEIEGASDHLVSEAVYLSDPEGNGIEIYRDRPRQEWLDANGAMRMANAQLDGQGLLNLSKEPTGRSFAMPRGARIGHVHLCVNDLTQASAAMQGRFGLSEMFSYPGAIFFGADGYHHHIATNIWRKSGNAKRTAGQLGLAEVTLGIEDGVLRNDLKQRWNGDERITDLDGLTFALAAQV